MADAALRTTAPPAWAAELFATPLAAVAGASGEATVWSLPGARTDASISAQFTANAGEYHTRYAASAHFEGLFRQAIDGLGLRLPEAPLILDIGSGSGVNSIVPCVRLFPAARQVASDLSAELLAMLAGYAADQGLSDQVVCVVMDAMRPALAAERFDLVTGAAILHHLTQPQAALMSAARVLKPGGRAIFFEPFDGYGLLRLAFERILAEAALRREPLAPEAERVLSDMASDIAARTTPDYLSPDWAAMDDKWLFSREFIEMMARDAGFAQVAFIPHNNHAGLYRDATAVQLRLGSGAAGVALPDWAWAILDGFDAAMTMQAKNQLMLEATVVLTKAG